MNTLVIDCRSRNVMVYTASITRSPDASNLLVLRYGVEIGKLFDILCRSIDIPRDITTVVTIGSYFATQSEGYCVPRSKSATEVRIVGEVTEGSPLRRVKPIPGFILNLRSISVPKGMTKDCRNSNPQRARSVASGVELLQSIFPQSVFIEEGQSDYTQYVSIESNADFDLESIPIEHREYLFSKKELVLSAAKAVARKRVLGVEKGDNSWGDGDKDKQELMLRMGAFLVLVLSKEVPKEHFSRYDPNIDLNLFSLSIDEAFEILKEMRSTGYGLKLRRERGFVFIHVSHMDKELNFKFTLILNGPYSVDITGLLLWGDFCESPVTKDNLLR